MHRSMPFARGLSAKMASASAKRLQQSVRTMFTNNSLDLSAKHVAQTKKDVAFVTRFLSTQVPKEEAVKPAAQKHDGAAIFGKENWMAIVQDAVKNINAMFEARQNDAQASGINVTELSSSQRITAQRVHEQFRDLSKLGDDKHQQLVDLVTAAATFKTITRGDKLVSGWLFSVALLVFVMVVVGGLTRLTKSGLSMVHWKFTGEKRPSTEEEWESEFALYKQSPEFKLHNQHMTLNDFKFIYHMEYGHRTLGRIIGLVFTLPFIGFLATKRISLRTGLGKGLMVALALGALQGGIGWWMVKSGLTEEDNKVKAHVSPYRLATHLITAFALFSMLTVLAYKFKYGQIATMIRSNALPSANYMNSYSPTSLSHALAMMTFFTAASGAFVAGNEAGLIYNEFPLMGGQIIPDDIIDPNIKPVYKNITENATMVQFIHRCLAISTFSLAMFTAWKCHRDMSCFNKINNAAQAVATAATLQAGLGISTLLMGVPVHLAACHQAGAMLLLFTTLRLMFFAKNPVLSLDNLTRELPSFEASAPVKPSIDTLSQDSKDVKAGMALLLAAIGTVSGETFAEAMDEEEQQ